MTILGGTNYSKKQIARHFEGNVTREGAAKVRELYLAHKMTYVTAHAQLRTFFSMGNHQADCFLSDQPATTTEAIIRRFVNGTLSHSQARGDLIDAGFTPEAAQAHLQKAWEGK
jgi:hypothetical protein